MVWLVCAPRAFSNTGVNPLLCALDVIEGAQYLQI